MCSCEEGEQSVDHIIFDCKLLEQERTRLKAMVKKWPVSKVLNFTDTLRNSRTTLRWTKYNL
jgi:vacuolar-type H+-ATPase catalytic subunit A/Vma1